MRWEWASEFAKWSLEEGEEGVKGGEGGVGEEGVQHTP